MAQQGRDQRPDRDTTGPAHNAPANEAPSDQQNLAPESGEPGEAGRSHGRIINEDGTPAGEDAARASIDKRPEDGKQPHWESGRHQAD